MRKNFKLLLFLGTTLISVILNQSCKRTAVDEISPSGESTNVTMISESNKAKLIKDFATTLYRLCETKEVREILINEAHKEFDSNYDVLYQMIKDKKVNGKSTIRKEALKIWDSLGFNYSFDVLERALPLLNIHIPDFELVGGITPKDWDANSSQYAIAYQEQDKISMIVGNEDSPITIEKGDIPNIMTFFVNTNKRLIVKNQTLRSDGETDFQFDFIHPVLDKAARTTSLRNQWVEEEKEYENPSFYAGFLDDGVLHSLHTILRTTKNFHSHRSLLYYGEDHSKCDRSYNEYLLRFKIDPKAYYWITGKKEDGDPQIMKDATVVTYKQRSATIDEIINKIWTDGNFTFCFEIKTPLKNGSVETEKLIFPVKPKDLFVMNPSRERRHKTWFRRTRFTYKLHVDSLESRWVYPHINGGYPTRISKSWDLEQAGLYKKIYISELDKSQITERTESFSSSFVTNIKAGMDFKIPIKGAEIGFNFGFGENNTFNKGYQIKRTIQDNDDDLGEITLYFDDPIIDDVVYVDEFMGVKFYNLHNGCMTVSIVPGKKPFTNSKNS